MRVVSFFRKSPVLFRVRFVILSEMENMLKHFTQGKEEACGRGFFVNPKNEARRRRRL